MEQENATLRKKARLTTKKERELEAYRDRDNKIREHRATANEALAQARTMDVQKDEREREARKWRDRCVWNAFALVFDAGDIWLITHSLACVRGAHVLFGQGCRKCDTTPHGGARKRHVAKKSPAD